MTRSDSQWQFLQDVALLITYAKRLGMKLTGGPLYRDPDYNDFIGGTANSNHLRRQAIDLNLFDGQTFLQDTESHRPLGEFWKSLDSANRWGGDFPNADGNHYERHD